MKKLLLLAMVLGLLNPFVALAAPLYAENFEAYPAWTPASAIGFWGYGANNAWRVAQDAGGNKFMECNGGNYHLYTTATYPYGTSIEFDIRHSEQWDFPWPPPPLPAGLVNITYGFGLPVALTPPEKRNPDGWPIVVRTGGFNLYGWFMSDLGNYIMMNPQPDYSLYMGNWYHIEWVFNGTVLSSYVDGDLVSKYDFASSGSNFIEVPYYHIYWDGFDQLTAIDNIRVSTVDPVPEPASLLLLGSGLVVIGGYGRKKFFKK